MDLGMDALKAFDDAVSKMRCTGELSDQAVLNVRRRFELVEKRPEPLEMTGDEIAEFLDEHEVGVTWTSATKQTLRVVTLTADAFPTMKGQTLKEATGRAAAWMKEGNE